jgi:hypothetical protein
MRVDNMSSRGGACAGAGTVPAPRPLPDLARTTAGVVLTLAVASCSVRGLWSTLAALVMVAHCAYMLFVLLGGFLAVGRISWLWPHLAAATWGLVGALRPRPCPITTLEKWLIEQSGTPSYRGTFVNHYLDGTIWPAGRATDVWLLTAMLAAVSYVVALRAATQRRRVG